MGLLTVDPAKCRQDGICAAVCPRRIIEMEGEAGFPVVAPERETFCMQCGHCVAVCPHGAVRVAGVPLEACPEIDENLGLGWEPVVSFEEGIRKTIAYFRDFLGLSA